MHLLCVLGWFSGMGFEIQGNPQEIAGSLELTLGGVQMKCIEGMLLIMSFIIRNIDSTSDTVHQTTGSRKLVWMLEQISC